MAKRSATGLSFIVGIDKPAGMTSHDVVNRCRTIYGERRCGHTGTLDPAATGVLAVCVGPATRLDRYLTGHDKEYEFTIVFGTSTDTDDAEGTVLRAAPVPERVYNRDFASEYVSALTGDHKQMPPVFSAVKVQGRKSYEAARKGNIIELAPRDITIYRAQLLALDVDGEGTVSWTVRAAVSAGTYIRSIARDAGADLETCAHVGQLRRVRSGNLGIHNCVTLEALQHDPFGAILDPVKLLSLRFLFAEDAQAEDVSCGRVLREQDVKLFAYDARVGRDFAMCSCTSGVFESEDALVEGEAVCVVVRNELKAIYRYDAGRRVLKSDCGFATGVKRGCDI